ncbi:MAG: ATP-binding cassette domain-containing protein [Thermodesulfobacteriota bacterium]
MVDLKNVSLHRDRLLLDGINWKVERGQHWIVLGRNGAGKTLLLKILAGYLWPSQGEVNVLASRFGRVDLRELRQDIGWVSAALAEKIPAWDTALEVILSGAYATFGLYQQPSEELTRRAEGLMAEMGLENLSGQKFSALSLGEKQRVLLARSRLPQPALLILDEPCAGLDLAAREKFLALVRTMTEDRFGPTLIMVTHRVSEITPGFTHGLLLRQGRILAGGPLEDVLTGELLSQTLEVPLQLSRHNGRYQVMLEQT